MNDTPNDDQHSQKTAPADSSVPQDGQPVPQKQPAATPVSDSSVKQSNPATLVLQWLTYAFWGWFALGMLWLSFVAFLFYTKSDVSDWSSIVAYPIAAVVVLYLMAAITDFFYSRREPAHKTGIATAIMVIHTVIFALCGVGLVVTAVFTLIQLLINDNPDMSFLLSTLFTALVGVAVYIVLIIRSVLVAKIKKIAAMGLGFFGIVALLFIVLCAIGPMSRSIATRQDRQVEASLHVVQRSVDNYISTNKKLPTSLRDITINDTTNDNTQRFVDDGLITYEKRMPVVIASSYKSTSSVTYYYALCAMYDYDSGRSSRSRGSDADPLSYSSYIDTSGHKAGKQCYNLETTAY